MTIINPSVWSLLKHLCGLDTFDTRQETAHIDEIHHHWPTEAQKQEWCEVCDGGQDQFAPSVVHVGTYLECLGRSDAYAGAPIHNEGVAWGITVVTTITRAGGCSEFLSMELDQAIAWRNALDLAIGAANKAFKALEP